MCERITDDAVSQSRKSNRSRADSARSNRSNKSADSEVSKLLPKYQYDRDKYSYISVKVRKQNYLGSSTIAIYINDASERVKKKLQEKEMLEAA